MKVIIDSAEFHYWYWDKHGMEFDVVIHNEKYFRVTSGEFEDQLIRRVDVRNAD